MTSRTASESGNNDGISVFEAKGSTLRGVNGNVSFTVINVIKFKYSPYFLITPRIYFMPETAGQSLGIRK